VKYYDTVRGKVVDTRKNEPLSMIGFTSSILGLVPLFGIPFAILGWILGTKSLRKIRKYPERYKGIGLAKASVALGVIGVVVSIVFLFASLASAASSCGSSGAHV
jgi:uncharacterized membrane protein